MLHEGNRVLGVSDHVLFGVGSNELQAEAEISSQETNYDSENRTRAHRLVIGD